MSAPGLGSEHSIAKGFPTATENSWSRARLPPKPFNLLRWLLRLAVRLAMLQGGIPVSLEVLPGGGGIMPQARAAPRLLWLTALLQQPMNQALERSHVEIQGPPADPP